MHFTSGPIATEVIRRPLARPIALLAALLVAAGVGGMAVSYLYLSSDRPLDVTAGAAGFVAGAVLLVGGVVALATLARSPDTSESADHAVNCLWGLLPPGTAVLAWPTLVFNFFLPSIVLLPLTLLGCTIWAGLVSGRVGRGLWGLWGPAGVEPTRGVSLALRWVVFGLQLAVILASWDVFGEVVNWLEHRGYRFGWP